KLLGVEIFNRVPLPVSGKARKKVKGKVLSTGISCLQGNLDWDPIAMRDFLNRFMDPFYASFLLNAVAFVIADVRANVLQGRALYITEKDPQTRRSHPSLDCLILKPFPILPKYGYTPKFIIVNTDAALFDLWSLAGLPGVPRPINIAAFKGDSDTWWRRTFCIEQVETVQTGNRRFRGAVYLDGVSCRVSVKKKVSGSEIEEDDESDDGGGGGEVAVADAGEDSDDEFRLPPLRDIEGTSSAPLDKKRKRTTKSHEPPKSSPPLPVPGFDQYFVPVDIPEGTTVWGIDPGRRDPIHAVSSTGQTYRVSLAHYYQLCGFTGARKRREKWMKQSPTVQDALNRMSHETYKTSELDTFDRYLNDLLPNLSLLLDFYFRQRHRRSGIDSYIRTQKAWHEITRPFANSVVALGAALFAHNSRRHATGPLKKLRQKLKDRAYALRLIGEYNTSRVCHVCDGFFDANNQRWWALRVCRDVCNGQIFNRDYNAAKNILEIFFFMNENSGMRPEPFFYGWEELPPRPGVHQ
ncbi:hypothetical protein HK104_001820, partial [Borealophlyctis nickersoniae]